MLDHLEEALIFLANHPHDILGDVNLVNAKERQRLVADLYPEEQLSPTQNISELIESQVSETPEKIAVRHALISLDGNRPNHACTATIRPGRIPDI